MEERKLNRRDFLRLSAAVATGAIAAACAPAAPQVVQVEKEVPVKEVVVQTVEVEKVVEKVVEKKVEVREPVTIHSWDSTSRESEGIVTEFEEQYPYIKVELSELGEAVFGDEKFLTAVAAGKGPDVARQNRHTFMQFAAKGVYQDVTPFFDQDGLKSEDYFPVQFAETSWDGKIYGLPRETDTRLLYWNRKHFEEAGLDPDRPPETWAELEEYTVKLNKKDAQGDFQRMGFVPYLVGNSWMWLYGFLNKAPAISEDKRTILCDDERWVEALQWLVDFYDNYLGSFEITSAFTEGTASHSMQDAFILERVSMVAHCDTIVTMFLRKPDLDWDVAPMPIPPQGEKSSWSCGWSIVLAPSARHPEAGWEFMKWWTGLDGWRARAKVYKAETARVWEREQITGEPLYMPQDAVYIPAAEMLEKEYVSEAPELLQKQWTLAMDCLANWTHGCGTEMGVSALEYWVEIDNAVRNALAHKMTPQEAMSACKKKVQEATDRAWEAIEQAGKS